MSDYSNLSTDQIDNQITQIENVVGRSSDKPEKSYEAEKHKEIVRDDERRSEMGQVFDRLQAANEKRSHEEAVLKPVEGTGLKGATLEDTFSRTYDFLHMRPEERVFKAAVRNEVDTVKQFAKEHGLSVEQAELMRLSAIAGQRAQPQIPAELHSSMKSVRQMYPDQPFHQITQRYSEIDKMVKADPVQGVAWIAKQSGLNPLQLAQQLAMRFGDPTIITNNATRLVEEFFASNPDAAKLEGEMLAAIQGEKFRRTGSIANDLQTALNHARRQQRSERKTRRQGKHIENSMSKIYDKVNSK